MKFRVAIFLVLIVISFQVWSQEVPDSARRLRFLTFNIYHGATMKGDFDLDYIAGVIKRADPDLVALQEVDFLTRRASGVDLATELGWRLKMVSVFAPAMKYDGGEY